MAKRGRAPLEAAQAPEAGLQNNLKAIRTRLNLSQAALAQAAGVTRQTIGGIEASLYAPSAVVALKLARALGCRVEELFWVEDNVTPTLSVRRAQGGEDGHESATPRTRVMLGQVEGDWVAHPLSGDAAWRSEMVPADGILEELLGDAASQSGSAASRVAVRLLDTPESLARTVLIAGCAPALSLWTRSAERWHPGLRAAWLHANSTVALSMLARGEVHIAGLHMCDAQGEDNLPLVRRVMGETRSKDAKGSPLVLLNFGIWDEGLIVARDNPLRLRSVADLARPEVTIINREAGSGARALLDMLLTEATIEGAHIRGYGSCVTSHQAVAQVVRDGRADAGMGAQSVAEAFGVGFVPLRRVRYDLALRAASLDFEPVRDLLDALAHRRVRAQLRVLGGYDTALTGEIVARFDPGVRDVVTRHG